MATPTGALFNDPRAKPLSTSGQFQAGCYYCFFSTLTTTPTPVYADGFLTTQLSQPAPGSINPVAGTVAAGDGRFVPIYLDPTVIYRVQLYNAAGQLLEDVDPYVPPRSGTILATFAQSAAEIAAGVIPANTNYPWGDIRRYGAALDGVTDDTAAVRAWISVGGALTFPVAQTALISGEINVPNNTSVRGVQGATILQTAADAAIFRSTNTTDVEFHSLKTNQNYYGAAAYVAHYVFDGVTRGSVIDCEVVGPQWAGVYLRAARHCTVRGNYMHDAFPLLNLTFTVAPNAGATSAVLSAPWTLATGNYTVLFTEAVGGANEGRQVAFIKGQTSANWASTGVSGPLAQNCTVNIQVQPASDSGDVVIHSSPTAAAAYNIVDGNFLYCNSFEEGAEIQDPYNGVLPTRNIITNNRITGHLGYGILEYMPDTGDGYNEITNNFIENIQGNYAFNLSTGAGIYLSGAGIGGTIVSGNQIRNCCINTANASLAPAGIGVAGGVVANGAPISIIGNVITDMSQYHGILITGLLNGATVTGNSIRMPAANSTGHGISIVNSQNVTLTGNPIMQLATVNNGRCIIIQGLGGGNCSNIVIVGNTLTGGNFNQIEFSGTGGGRTDGFTIQGNTVAGGTANATCLALSACDDGNVVGNFFNTTGSPTVSQAACTNIRYAANRLKGAGTVLSLTGANTGSYYDISNVGVTAPGLNNAGTGMQVALPGTAVPASGTWAVGDVVQNTAPTTPAGVFYWICTTPGAAPGVAVFKTISNT